MYDPCCFLLSEDSIGVVGVFSSQPSFKHRCYRGKYVPSSTFFTAGQKYYHTLSKFMSRRFVEAFHEHVGFHITIVLPDAQGAIWTTALAVRLRGRHNQKSSCSYSPQLKDKERQVIKERFKVIGDQRNVLVPGLVPIFCFLFWFPIYLLTLSSLWERALMMAWKSCVKSRRLGPSRTQSRGTPSGRPRKRLCKRPTLLSSIGDDLSCTGFFVQSILLHSSACL